MIYYKIPEATVVDIIEELGDYDRKLLNLNSGLINLLKKVFEEKEKFKQFTKNIIKKCPEDVSDLFAKTVKEEIEIMANIPTEDINIDLTEIKEAYLPIKETITNLIIALQGADKQTE